MLLGSEIPAKTTNFAQNNQYLMNLLNKKRMEAGTLNQNDLRRDQTSKADDLSESEGESLNA